MRSPDPLALAPEPPRYPLAIAACWIAGCGVTAGAAGSGVRTELLYLPAILALAWYYGLEKRGLLVRDAEKAYLSTGPADEDG